MDIQKLLEAEGTLIQIMIAEGADPETDRFLLEDIVTDLGNILTGMIGIENGETWDRRPLRPGRREDHLTIFDDRPVVVDGETFDAIPF